MALHFKGLGFTDLTSTFAQEPGQKRKKSKDAGSGDDDDKGVESRGHDAEVAAEAVKKEAKAKKEKNDKKGKTKK